MQKWLAQNRSRLPAATGALVALAFGAKLILGNGEAARLIFLVASLLGILPIAYEAVQALKVHVVSIDLLVTIAMLGAFAIQEYEGSAAVAFLFLFGAYLEQRTLAKTRSAMHGLTEMVPETALRKTDGGTFEETDIVQVQTGGKVTVDGTVLAGSGTVDESSITGEPVPAEKVAGSPVFAGTILANGTPELVAERTGEDTAFGRIAELVEEAQDTKTPAGRFIDCFSKHYTPVVLAIALIVWVVTRNMELAVTILVLGCTRDPRGRRAGIECGRHRQRHQAWHPLQGKRCSHTLQLRLHDALRQDRHADLRKAEGRARALLGRRLRGEGACRGTAGKRDTDFQISRKVCTTEKTKKGRKAHGLSSPSLRQALSGLYAASMRSRPGCAAIISSAETERMAGSS